MSKSSEFLLWVVFAGLAVLQFTDANRIRDDIAVVRICNATDPVSLDVFNDYMMHHDFNHLEKHSRQLSCFLLCIYSEYKWMNRHGIFRVNKIKSWMSRANLSPRDREILLYKCVTAAELLDPCARARKFTECFWFNHQTLEKN